MKTFLFSMIAAIAIWSCNSGNAAPKAGDVTTIQWIDSARNMGTVTEGQIVNVDFRFKNTGTKPLVIIDVKASCGCTVPERPEAPIAPGEEGEIKATFKSQGRVGTNNKTITVMANTGGDQMHKLHFNVEVQAAPANAAGTK